MTNVVRAMLIALLLTLQNLGEDTQEKEGMIIFLPFAHLYNLG